MTLPLRTPSLAAALLLAAVLAPLGAVELDDRIVATASETYNFKTYLKDDKINVVAKKGTVTLTGRVRDDFHRALAEETVAGLPGVKSVNNQLSLEEAPKGLDPDTRLRGKVQAALLFHRGLSTIDTTVWVDQGVVTLQGQADTEAQKKLATEYVKGLDGVVRVVNEMTVLNPPRRRAKEIRKKIDDASITAQVKMALLFNKATSALHTRVSTENGVVHLGGTARSQAEKELVTRMVRTIDGVQGIRNRMTIGS